MDLIKKQDGRFWGFAYLRPRTEKVVARSLQGKGIVSYLPLVPKARLHHGTKIITPVPMIPGYIFLALDDIEKSDLKRGDDNFVYIQLVRDSFEEDTFISELNALHRFEQLAQTEKVLVQPGIQIGDRILITQGSLAGMEANVIRRDDDNNSIVINLTLLDKNVEYPVSLEHLKKITS